MSKCPLSKNERGLNNRELGNYRRSVLERHDYDPDDLAEWRLKWSNFCKNKVDGVENEITFPLYVAKARKAGLASYRDIGQHPGQYQMGRKTDRGPYTKTSCRFILMQQNQEERKLNGGTAIAVEKAARVRRGQTKENSDSIASMAEKLEGRTADTHRYLKIAARKKGRSFEVFSPSGRRYAGKGLNTLCTRLGLNQAGMSLLCRGEKQSFNGWTGSYTDDPKPYFENRKKKCKKATKEAVM